MDVMLDLESLRRHVLRLPVFGAVALVVAASIVLSSAATMVMTVALYGGVAPHFWRYMSIAVAVPTVVAGPVSWLIVRLLQEVDVARGAAMELAWKDELTGLLNRRRFVKLAQRELDRAPRQHRPLAVAMVDLDDFKRINDELGHLAGDQLLRVAARSCVSVLRATDLVGRWGGEEFALVLPDADAATARAAAERVRQAIESACVAIGNGSAARCTASLGVVLMAPAGARFEDLVGRADEAMYEAKRLGKNRVRLAA